MNLKKVSIAVGTLVFVSQIASQAFAATSVATGCYVSATCTCQGYDEEIPVHFCLYQNPEGNEDCAEMTDDYKKQLLGLCNEQCENEGTGMIKDAKIRVRSLLDKCDMAAPTASSSPAYK